MKRIFLITTIVLFMLFIAFWIYIQSDVFSLRIRPLIAGPLQNVLGPGAEFGRIKANLLPLYLEVRDVTIPTSRNSEAIAIRRIRVRSFHSLQTISPHALLEFDHCRPFPEDNRPTDHFREVAQYRSAEHRKAPLIADTHHNCQERQDRTPRCGHPLEDRRAKDQFQPQDDLSRKQHGHAACFKRAHVVSACLP
jgi:hypothetical protein